MRAAIVCSGLVVLAACGGAAPAAAKPAQPAPRVATKRVPIEDSELPEENVQIINARGRMEPAAVSAGIDPHAAELSACYMTRVGKRKWLGGHVALHWDIRADGQVTSVKLAESDLGAHEIERCLLDVAKAAKFTKPIGGDADFALPLSFNAPGSAKGGAQVWDEDKGLRAIGGQLAKLDTCAPKGESLPNDVVITVYVGPRGAAQSVGFASSASEIAPKWEECASKAAMAWRLPDPKGQVAKLAVRYRPAAVGSK